MATITSLSSLSKGSVSANDFLLVANSSVPTNYKFQLQELFPVLNTAGTSSEALFVNTTNKNTLNFKGIKSLSNLLTVATASDNIVLTVNPANIDLSTCNNGTSAFLSSVSLTGAYVSGTLPVANGGTGATTLSANSLILGNGGSALSSLGAATDGQIPIGRTGLAPILSTITAGSNITITNASGSITIGATVSTASSAFNLGSFNIYGTGWYSGDGGNEGLKVDSSGRVFAGSSAPTSFFNGDLNVNQDIYLKGSTSQVIKMADASAPAGLSIRGSAATTANPGGGINIYGGTSSGAANAGGSINIYSGSHDGSGTSGDTNFWGYSTAAVAQRVLTLKGESRYVGITNASPSAPLDIKQDDSSANIPVLELEQLDTGESFINFVGTSGLASANSISSSTASAGSKVGAIQVKINGTARWIRFYDTAE
jgi:hypothetical protein